MRGEKLTADAQVVQYEAPESAVPAYRPFPVDLLPEPIRGYIRAEAAAIGCDFAFVALPILAAIVSAIGSRRRIRLKKRWTEPAIIWTLIIAMSGGHKSPGFDAGMRAVKKRQEKSKRRYAEAMKVYAVAMKEYKAARKDAGGGNPELTEPTKPTMERTWTDNATMEAIASPILSENPRGVLLGCDELSAWFGSFDRYAKAGSKTGADAARWMHLHGGALFRHRPQDWNPADDLCQGRDGERYRHNTAGGVAANADNRTPRERHGSSFLVCHASKNPKTLDRGRN